MDQRPDTDGVETAANDLEPVEYVIGMENDNKPVSQDNWGQIIRKDAKGCFVEVRNDTFHLDKVHLQFVSYDTTKPKGSRYVNNTAYTLMCRSSWPWPGGRHRHAPHADAAV